MHFLIKKEKFQKPGILVWLPVRFNFNAATQHKHKAFLPPYTVNTQAVFNLLHWTNTMTTLLMHRKVWHFASPVTYFHWKFGWCIQCTRILSDNPVRRLMEMKVKFTISHLHFLKPPHQFIINQVLKKLS